MPNQAIHDVMVWAGVHGEEHDPGVELVWSLGKYLLAMEGCTIDAAIANPRAFAVASRQIDVNLALVLQNPWDYEAYRSINPGMTLPDGVHRPWGRPDYERTLVPGLIRRSWGKDLIVDMHQNLWEGHQEDCAWVGPSVRPYVLGFIALCGITNVLVCDGGFQGYFPEAVLMDIYTESCRNNVAFWRDKLSRALREGLATPSLEDFKFYAQGDLSTAASLSLKGGPFEPLKEEVPHAAELFNVDRPVYSLLGGSREFVTPLAD
ncbi:MAG TPA: hypothetical protein VGS08_02985 [Candidatus Saccharimonadales bacterium]|nr:hypothetical protein [Candidatus Saccharimonadales bacterium]